jgi:uncharacterized protein (TIGR03435 family)
VVDKTGITGPFEFHLMWLDPGPDGNLPAAFPAGPPSLPFLTALQERLGLKLESARAAFDVLVIDSGQRPSEN